MAQYELILLGSPSAGQVAVIADRMVAASTDFGMAAGDGIAVRVASSAGIRNTKSATAVLYFGGDPSADVATVDELIQARTPVIPVVLEGAKVGNQVPPCLQPINACFVSPTDMALEGVCALALESLGLLHEQRRVFVSYRRDDSREAAVQLHDELSAKAFDVFLDTHSIRPGSAFQELLWHRLADCDIVVMLDTAGYFESKWTKQELGRALAHGIHVLRLVWPGHTPSKSINLSDTTRLQSTDVDASGRLQHALIPAIVAKAETLRSLSIASRHRLLVGKLRTEVQGIGGSFGGVGAYHATPIDLPNGLKIQAYPAVGVPSALLLNEIYRKASASAHGRRPCLIYDDTGLSSAWREHLTWLDTNISNVKAVRVSRAGREFAGWDI